LSLSISPELLKQIHQHGEAAFPDEGAGFLLGTDGDPRHISAILPLENSRQGDARRNRYLITPQDYLRGENEADRLGLTLLGVFHSHPDHPNQASEYDRDWAQPYFSYIITSIYSGKAVESRSWRLTEDRSQFLEETIAVTQAPVK
jgi:proteasome lid subunit RPN8/RPN11